MKFPLQITFYSTPPPAATITKKKKSSPLALYLLILIRTTSNQSKNGYKIFLFNSTTLILPTKAREEMLPEPGILLARNNKIHRSKRLENKSSDAITYKQFKFFITWQVALGLATTLS